MKRCFLQSFRGPNRLRAAVLGAFALLPAVAFGPLAAVRAQIDPDDSGEGVKLGLTQRHNSGQIGTVTLLERGPEHTLLALRIFSVPPGRSEPARLVRGSCERPSRGTAESFALVPVEGGRSRSVVPTSLKRLTTENYAVVVFARAGSGRVSCGNL